MVNLAQRQQFVSTMTNVFHYVVMKIFHLSPVQIRMSRKLGGGGGGAAGWFTIPVSCRVGKEKETADSWTHFLLRRKARCSFLACLPALLCLYDLSCLSLLFTFNFPGLKYVYSRRFTNPGNKVAGLTIFHMLAPNVCGSLAWKFMSPFRRPEFWSGS